MLVLSRKLNEKILIGDDIVLTIVKIDRHQVRIGIEAPNSVPVFRKELLDEKAAREELGSHASSEANIPARAAVPVPVTRG